MYSHTTLTFNNNPESIADSFISNRTKKCMQNGGVIFWKEITEYRKKDMFKWRNIGKKTVEEIEKELHKRGLVFNT